MGKLFNVTVTDKQGKKHTYRAVGSRDGMTEDDLKKVYSQTGQFKGQQIEIKEAGVILDNPLKSAESAGKVPAGSSKQ